MPLKGERLRPERTSGRSSSPKELPLLPAPTRRSGVDAAAREEAAPEAAPPPALDDASNDIGSGRSSEPSPTLGKPSSWSGHDGRPSRPSGAGTSRGKGFNQPASCSASIGGVTLGTMPTLEAGPINEDAPPAGRGARGACSGGSADGEPRHGLPCPRLSAGYARGDGRLASSGGLSPPSGTQAPDPTGNSAGPSARFSAAFSSSS